MKIALTIVAVLVGLLSVAAGAAKIALVPEEVEFLSQFGFSTALTICFGVAQVLGGLLLVIPPTRFKSAGIEHGRMLYRISGFQLPTLGAIGVELSRLPELFRLIGRFDRVAVLAEKKWIQNASEIEGALIPGLMIKAFDPDQKADAEAWLAG